MASVAAWLLMKVFSAIVMLLGLNETGARQIENASWSYYGLRPHPC